MPKSQTVTNTTTYDWNGDGVMDRTDTMTYTYNKDGDPLTAQTDYGTDGTIDVNITYNYEMI